MSALHALVVILAGMWAGTINAIVGSGSLVTFPVLLLLGYPPVTANVSNNLGLVAGGVTASYGYRRELRGQGPTLVRMVPMSMLGSTAGALLLLVLPASAFSAIVPVLIVFGLLMVVFGPRIQAWSKAHHHESGESPSWQRLALLAGIAVAGVYGGYFGAAQGVILMGLLSTLATGDLQTLNGIKNVLGTCVNIVAAIVFLIVARDHIDWWVVLFITIGAVAGGVIGASIGRRLPAPVLRAVILVVGVVGIVKLVWFP
ncbi:MAG: sulfite exporter TauE/SafE family protein [Dermatophilaceae bacterium]